MAIPAPGRVGCGRVRFVQPILSRMCKTFSTQPLVPLLVCVTALLLGCRPANDGPGSTSQAEASQTEAVQGASSSQTQSADQDDARGTVTIEINSGQHSRTIKVENVRDGDTLESVMRRIDEVPISIRGSGVTAFVDAIGDVETSGRSGWTYRIDGEFAHEGIGTVQLHPPTTITWTFGDETGMPENP